MPLMRWSPMWPSFDEDFDKMFRDFPKISDDISKGFVPAVNMYQTDNTVVVETPLPGIDPKDVNISIENNVLTIDGKSEKKSEIEEKDYWRKEVRSGSFYRQVALPVHVMADKADANFENGMLKIEIPKAAEVKAKKIEIKAATTKAKKDIKKKK